MAFEEKMAWVTLVSITLVYGAYFWIIADLVSTEPIAEIGYQGLMIATVVGVVFLAVAGSIVVALSNPKRADEHDERDKSIARRAGSISGIVLGAGVFIPLVLAMADAESFWIAQAILAALVVSQIAEDSIRIYFYRRGV